MYVVGNKYRHYAIATALSIYYTGDFIYQTKRGPLLVLLLTSNLGNVSIYEKLSISINKRGIFQYKKNEYFDIKNLNISI